MNILTSYNWLKEYLETNLSPEEFAKQTTAAGNGVEHFEYVKDRFEKMVVGEVKAVNAHPNADKLKLVDVKIGMVQKVEIVCGGANLAEGMKVAVALPGAKVRWHGEGDLVTLAETEIRGVKSHGMICAASEIGFEKLPEGPKDIWDITDITEASAGTPLAEALGLDDVLMDIEVTTNRPDAKSIIGQAREGSAVTGDAFTWKTPTLEEGSAELSVAVEDGELCPMYEAIAIENVKVAPSPWWLQARLLMAGMKPINNIVDITNYVLHEYGQPLHAFDANKISGSKLIVRRAEQGEEIVALDGETYKLSPKMLVIADEKEPVAIAGVMGGLATGTIAQTSHIILESATFEPVSIRRTSRALNLASDSSQLFEKGLSTEATTPAMARAVELILEIAGGNVASKKASVRNRVYEPKTLSFEFDRARALIGVAVPDEEMVGSLTRLGFEVSSEKITVPHWRHRDIEDPVDFIEEIARLYGYDNIPSKLPESSPIMHAEDPLTRFERRLKEQLRGAGFDETYSNAFASEKELSRYNIPATDAVKLENPLSNELSYMRPSLVPTMLTTIEANQFRMNDMALFEIAPVYTPAADDIPSQHLHLVMAVTGEDGYSAFRKLRGALSRLGEELGLRTLRLERASKLERFHPGRSAVIWVGEHEDVGTIGELHPSLNKAFDLEPSVVIAEISLDRLLPHVRTVKSYHPIPTYQDVKRDLAFIVAEKTVYEELEHVMREAAPLLRSVELFDIYRGKGVEEGKKSMAVHLSFRANDRTLSSEEVEKDIAAITAVLQERFGAIMR